MIRIALAFVLTVAPTIAAAQHTDPPRRPAGPEAPAWPALSAKARQQIKEVEKAALSIASPLAANDAGFAPVLGWVPTMGVHWVNEVRAADGRPFELTAPDQLMFSRINGRETLVGAAYSYLAPVNAPTRPDSFDGNPAWHEHPNLAPAGQTLVMLHVWLVPSPDGPFADHNPNLPFWAYGLTPPDVDQMRDPARNQRFRKTALAIGEVVDSAGLFPVLQRRQLRLATQLSAHRAEIRRLIPELAAAQEGADWMRWDAVADRMAAQWVAMREAYLSFAPNQQAHERMRRLMDGMATGAQGASDHHH
ncbi:MAG: hypothetical protein ACREMA_07340 [Longimicrobiales bacterium]